MMAYKKYSRTSWNFKNFNLNLLQISSSYILKTTNYIFSDELYRIVGWNTKSVSVCLKLTDLCSLIEMKFNDIKIIIEQDVGIKIVMS